MGKRNARKQATREELEATDPVCHRLTLMQDDADMLVLTMGADYESSEKPDDTAYQYEERLGYLGVLLSELVDLRTTLLLAETKRPTLDITPETSEKDPTAQEGSTYGHDEPENE